MGESVRFDMNGTTRVGVATVEINGEPLEIAFEPAQLAGAMADAAAKAIANEIRGISERAPDGHQLFNRTGRLVAGIVAQQVAEETFDVVPPEGYLQDDRIVERLIDLVPTLDTPEESLKLNAVLVGQVDDVVIKTR